MSKSIPGNQKHMTMDDRIVIEKGLDANQSLRSIAQQLGKGFAVLLLSGGTIFKTVIRIGVVSDFTIE